MKLRELLTEEKVVEIPLDRYNKGLRKAVVPYTKAIEKELTSKYKGKTIKITSQVGKIRTGKVTKVEVVLDLTETKVGIWFHLDGQSAYSLSDTYPSIIVV